MAKIKSIMEPFDSFVQKQLMVRKAIMSNPRNVEKDDEEEGKFNISEDYQNDSRSTPTKLEGEENSIYGPEHFFTYTTEKQAIIRMMSGVDLQDEIDAGLLEIQQDENGDIREYTTHADSRSDELYLDHSMGLAKQYILEGGTRYYNDQGGNKGTREGFTSGVFDDDTHKGFSYGDRDIRANASDGFGVVPMPGIVDAEIRTKSDNGSLREAKVNYVCYNRRQLEVLELLYMRPGYVVCLEWGWNPYISNDFTRENNDFSIKNDFFKEGADMNLLNEKIRQHKINSGGNFDGFIGFIKNFEFKAREDGGYDCTTEIMAHGEILESLKSTKITVKTGESLPNEESEEVESIDRFLYYLRSIKATLNNEGDQWYYKNRGAYYDDYDSRPSEDDDIYTFDASTSMAYHCAIRREGCDLISEYSSDPSEFGYSEVDCTYGYDGLCATKNYKIQTRYGEPLFNPITIPYLGDEGEEEYVDPNAFEGTTEEHMEALNKENLRYKKGYDDILNLYSSINKTLEIANVDSSNTLGQGYVPLVGGTILKQIVKYDGEFDGDGELVDTGYRKNIYVRWDMVCQIINHLSTHEKIVSDNHLRAPITELSYMHRNELTFANSPPKDGRLPHTEEEFQDYLEKGGYSYIRYEPPTMNDTDPHITTYSGQGVGATSIDDATSLELNGGLNTGNLSSTISFGSPSGEAHPILGSSFDERVCLLPHMPMFNKYYDELANNSVTLYMDADFSDGEGGTTETFNAQFDYLQSHIPVPQPFINKTQAKSQIGLIYLNLDFLIETYESMRLKTVITENMSLTLLNDKFNMFDYIKSLWKGVNSATADMYKFTITTEHDRPHVARIIDMRFNRNNDEGIHIFEPQGLKSVTRQFYFSSKISNDMASMISIAAQAPNNSQSLESLSFKAFHKNIRSRFATKEFQESERAANELQASEQLKDDIKEYQKLCTSLSYYLYKLNMGNFETEGEDALKLINNSEAVMSAQSILDLRHSILMRHPLEDSDGNPNDGSTNEVEGDNGELSQVTQAKAGYWRKGTTMDNSAIIPLQFSIQMDGLAGMIPLQIFKVDKDKLPFGYQRKDIVFIVKSESHKITSGQDWTVEITGQMALLNLSPNNMGGQGTEHTYINSPLLDPLNPEMSLSPEGSNFITSFEGFRSIPYADGFDDDGNQKYAVGYGTQTWKGQKVTATYPMASDVTATSAEVEMVKHLEKSVYPYIKNHVTVDLSQMQFDAVVSYTYNVGAGNSVAGDTQFIAKLNAGNYEGASKEIDIISMSQGNNTWKVVEGLMTRRAKEQRLFSGHSYGYDTSDGDWEGCQLNGCPPGRNESQNNAYVFSGGYSTTAFPSKKFY